MKNWKLCFGLSLILAVILSANVYGGMGNEANGFERPLPPGLQDKPIPPGLQDKPFPPGLDDDKRVPPGLQCELDEGEIAAIEALREDFIDEADLILLGIYETRLAIKEELLEEEPNMQEIVELQLMIAEFRKELAELRVNYVMEIRELVPEASMRCIRSIIGQDMAAISGHGRGFGLDLRNVPGRGTGNRP